MSQSSAVDIAGCGAPEQGAPLPASVDLEKETVITGIVQSADGPGQWRRYVRLLDSSGEFTAEVVTSPAGQFRFFAAPGNWTLRALSRLRQRRSRGVREPWTQRRHDQGRRVVDFR